METSKYAAHQLAKFALSSSKYSFFNNNNLPVVVHISCKEDFDFLEWQTLKVIKKKYTVFERSHRKLSHNWAARTKVQNKSTTICKLHGHIIHKYFLPKKSTAIDCVICPYSYNDLITILGDGSLCPRIKCFFIPPTFDSFICCYACIVSFHVWFFLHMEHFIRSVIYAYEVVLCTARGDNESLFRLWEGLHFI